MNRVLPGIERVLFVGFMGSGKTTVGRCLATRLGWDFVDFDIEIEARLERPIKEIFEQDGESSFRAAESEIAAELLTRVGVVLASGGGWPAVPGNWEKAPLGTFSVWLEVGAETAIGRIAGDPTIRPLLALSDPFDQARALISEREQAYQRADRWVVTDGLTPRQVTDEIESLVITQSHPD